MSNEYLMGKYDIVVIGAGHAGCEAALAAARMGKSTLLLAMNLESVAMMPCNPSIGGTGKGHLVREIDALGGEMGLNIDKTMIQMRMLNTAKGPAVHSLRAQADKHLYHVEMKKTIEKTANLDLKQGEVVELLIEKEELTGSSCTGCPDTASADSNNTSASNNAQIIPRVRGVKMATGALYEAKAVILCTGTFLNGRVFIGEQNFSSGPNGLAPSCALGEHLKTLGLPMRRFKTGTPARVLGSTLDYSEMTEQVGDDPITPFSFMNEEIHIDQISCWLTYTNDMTHDIIRRNFHRSALFGGFINGIGPRYCPSIEDKLNRFKDKKRHQLFVEPEGLSTDEMYLQGMSTSLPEDVQQEFYASIPGLKDVKIVRPGYAIEYDCLDPQSLSTNLESKLVSRLFCAGQFNGSSGYEEAAAQGIMAGINAVLKIDEKEPFVLDRSEAYIGVLIDDLILKGTNEPYRIMTSRAEYRLVLRQDNADIRLTEKSYRLGLASEERYQKCLEKQRIVEEEIERLSKIYVTPEQANDFLERVGTTPLKNKVCLTDLIRRPEVNYYNAAELDPERQPLPSHAAANIMVRLKYAGYIDKQAAQIEKFKKLEHKQIPKDLDYADVSGLRIEARQKLSEIRPMSIGQASRISGVSPADVNVLMVHLEKERRRFAQMVKDDSQVKE